MVMAMVWHLLSGDGSPPQFRLPSLLRHFFLFFPVSRFWLAFGFPVELGLTSSLPLRLGRYFGCALFWSV